MWIVANDLPDASTEEFETEEAARKCYDEWVAHRDAISTMKYRIYIAKVLNHNGEKSPYSV